MTQLTLDFSSNKALKRCTCCGETKPVDDFYRASANPESVRYRYRAQPCKRCTKGVRKRWRDENADVLLGRQIGYNIRARYGVDLEDYETHLAAQGGGCAICGTPPGKRRHHIDHDHQTGAIRGILCNRCNTGIGLLGEDIALMERAAAYLEGAT